MKRRIIVILALLAAVAVCVPAVAEALLIEADAEPVEVGALVVAGDGAEDAPEAAEGALAFDALPEGDGAPLYRQSADIPAIGEGAPAPELDDADSDGGEEDVLSNGKSIGLGVAAHSQAKIQAFVNAHPAYAGQLNLYSVAATDAPYAVGRLSKVNQRSALNLLNQLRYIAGLNADLKLLDSQEEAMAAAALVLRLNGALTHYPERPDALADSAYDGLYDLGFDGAGHANIAKGYKVTGAILAYMADSDADNIATLGHRRWILNPAMGRTVMGANGSYSAMYAHDMSGSGSQTRVAWPAQQTPVQYFSPEDPWSLSFGRELDAAGVEVALTRRGDGRVWRFSQAAADGFFNVDNHSYGQRGCVIFRPDGLGSLAPGDVFDVAVADGAGTVVRYAVNFFSLDLSAAEPLAQPAVTAEKTAKGNALRWSAVSGAKGYYVCRRTADTLYAIVADVKKTAWTDTKADPEAQYMYQVYPHTASVTSALATSVRPVAPAPQSVSLGHNTTVQLYANQTLQLTAELKPAYAEAALTWKSSKKKCATVDASGLVTPRKAGTTVVSVTTDNGLTAAIKVKVVAPPKPSKVALGSKGLIKLAVGERLTLAATLTPKDAVTQLAWRTADKGVARVSKKGVLTGVKPGMTTVTVKTANGKRASAQVVVTGTAPTGVALNLSGTVKLRVGEKLWLLATVTPGDAVTGLTWRSGNKKIASVSQKGIVKARRKGVTTVSVTTDNGLSARVKIKVTE